MWLLKTAFGLIDNFTPNVADPDLAKLYSVTLWIALVIALVMAFGQIGLAVLRQDGRGFGTLAAGVVQYGVVVSCWVAVCAGLIAAASGLTKGILDTLLGVDSFSGYAAGDGFVDHGLRHRPGGGARDLCAVHPDPGGLRPHGDHAGALGGAADPGRHHADRGGGSAVGGHQVVDVEVDPLVPGLRADGAAAGAGGRDRHPVRLGRHARRRGAGHR